MNCLLNPTHFNLELFNQAKNVPEVLQSSQGSTEFPRFYRVPLSKFKENRPRDSWVMIGHTNKHTEIRTLFNLKLCVNILFTSFILKYLVFSLSLKIPKIGQRRLKFALSKFLYKSGISRYFLMFGINKQSDEITCIHNWHKVYLNC